MSKRKGREGGIVFLVVLAAAVFADRSSSRADTRRQEAAPVIHHGFTLAPGRCELPQPDCSLRTPKAWAAPEIDMVKKALDEIVARPHGRDIIARAQQRRIGVLRRYALGLDDNSVAVPAIVATLRRDRYSFGIDVHDRFFANRDARDESSGTPGYLFIAQHLLHECLHAVDDVSDQPDFLKMVGFVSAGTAWRFGINTPEEVAALTRFEADRARFERSGDIAAQWKMNRTLALGMRPVRVPTMQSIRGPAEAFAEIGSHLILDPGARRYLPREFAVYFDANVFRRPPAR